MKPKDKAKELISLMTQHQVLEIEGHVNEATLFNNAKQCALICVDEVIEAMELRTPKHNDENNRVWFYEWTADGHEYVSYWEEVKQEIKNCE